MMPFSDWLADVDGKAIDVDGAAGPQCWDLAQDYLTRCLGGGSLRTGPSAHAGYAIGCWDGFSSNGLNQWFTQAPATATMLPGWVPIWKWGALFAPLSHIAVGIQDKGNNVSCMSQNPGNAHVTTLSKVGLAGYLVPKSLNNSGPVFNTVGDKKDTGNSVVGAVDTLAGMKQLYDDSQNAIHWLSDSGNWMRIGVYAIGGALLITALVMLLQKSPVAATAMDTVKGAMK